MSICQVCSSKHERPCTYEAMTKEYFDVLIKPLRHRARSCGYALAVHGSIKTDIDLVACPWRHSPIDAHSLAEELRKVAEAIIGIARIRDVDKARLPERKPCGRLAWSFYLVPDDFQGPYIDLSVMPVGAPESEPKKTKARK